MTLADIEKIPRAFLWAKEVAPLLGTTEETICWQAKHAQDILGFPVIVTGKHVRIPKEGFLYAMRYGKPKLHIEKIYIELPPESAKYLFDLVMKDAFSQLGDKGA